VARQVWTEASPHIAAGTQFVCATKGIEPGTLNLMCDVAAATLPQATFVALSGPSFADEVYQRQPTAVVAASEDAAAADATQQLFTMPYFRVYTGSDVIGVELAGSLKNTIAIAAGMLEGMGLGHNPLAALLTRGLAEISRMGLALGARQDTFAGLAGMGDLILTCTGGLSRNRQLGVLLAKGVTLDEYRATHRNVAEGVNAALAGTQLAARYEIDMPITRQVAEVLGNEVSATEALALLMGRSPKAEQEQ
jgi:glycerol-3-phosphate dehydrogenase (NAD(P)+)